MNNNFLMDQIDRAFSGVKKPSIIHNSPSSGAVAGEYLAIGNDFGSILKDEMSDAQCSMMIYDSSLISDEALCYYLPRLARAALQKRGLEDMLYRRLEKINKTFLSQEQKAALNHLIFTLKELERELEIEEEQELEQSWADWEEARMQSEAVSDKLLLAIARGSIEDVKKLINQGANVNERDNNGNSPLDIAKYKGHTEIVELLKQAGARE
ncbi:MAG TPA: hypothetical protein DDW76_10425 [Cyanobacteria bacterium UBA11369]|nr:hypothetical protein [Cyanobacteria bacterium UBA11371]HBE30774.1 hypothetical protein [Cyanobacteria bacterium UBA11368]HBE49187.1 hypothetical protein [Cyanobacteria bacterium UBA11369]